ncbi:PREDICTED: protein crumbs homolog 2-like [Papilio polytes]|uniref:protein crumbs homolog 2-like n=1 Tax=Papilio polytes TaxID=76194 RepID=UPI0006768691|nr:PREDICTED: protein crumbs homolog 2-like [Papilio polytes]
MKVDTASRERRGLLNVASRFAWLCLGLWAIAAAGAQGAAPAGPSARPEAYFNGSSYIRLARPVSLKQLVGLSFRTCVGGELFSQRFEGYTLHVTALLEQVVVSWARPGQQQRESACASSPCHNGTCLALDSGLFSCQCPAGYTGRFCESDKDECLLMPKICNNGVCVNVPGSYQCYCKPGYTGDSCEQDIDECLSSPCKNGGTCQNLENNYECTCMDGFDGKDCSININECENNPCAAGSTCVDGVASYSCVCQDGLTGPNCEIDIDDCKSQGAWGAWGAWGTCVGVRSRGMRRARLLILALALLLLLDKSDEEFIILIVNKLKQSNLIKDAMM